MRWVAESATSTRTVELAVGRQDVSRTPLVETAARRVRAMPLTCPKLPPRYTVCPRIAMAVTAASVRAPQVRLTAPVLAETAAALYRGRPPSELNRPPT